MSDTALIQVDPPKILAMHRKPTRVKGGDVVGVIKGTAIVPVITLDRPEVDHRTHSVRRLEPVAHADRVEIGWETKQNSDDQIIQQVKETASKMITDRMPLTKQLNLLAESQMVQSEGGDLKPYKKIYAWIQAVRKTSDKLETKLIDKGELPDFESLEVPFDD